MKYLYLIVFFTTLFHFSCGKSEAQTVVEEEKEYLSGGIEDDSDSKEEEDSKGGESTVKVIVKLQEWLDKPVSQRTDIRDEDFAKIGISKEDKDLAFQMLMKDHRIEMERKYSSEWDSRVLEYNNLEMPFFVKTYENVSDNGYKLYISMHGGGNAPKSVNDEQYENQKYLYDYFMRDVGGIYIAARAPTDTWNLWHESHIDVFFNILIQLAIEKMGVDPNKVYLLGYSAGGDGVYQLAPRMADRFAASSMMAGHPNESSPLGLRNLPFAIHVGELDSDYDRNKRAKEWGEALDQLHKQDTEGYIHSVNIHAKKAHWMELEDGVAISWMADYTRNTIPNKIVWKQDNISHNRFYWLGTPIESQVDRGEIIATYNKKDNIVEILKSDPDEIIVYLNDDMLDLNSKVIIKYQGDIVYNEIPKRNIVSIYETIEDKGDSYLSFPVKIIVRKP